MIWLPRTTVNSTYFAQSLEIRGIESRLYFCFYKKLNKAWYFMIIISLAQTIPGSKSCTFVYFSFVA